MKGVMAVFLSVGAVLLIWAATRPNFKEAVQYLSSGAAVSSNKSGQPDSGNASANKGKPIPRTWRGMP